MINIIKIIIIKLIQDINSDNTDKDTSKIINDLYRLSSKQYLFINDNKTEIDAFNSNFTFYYHNFENNNKKNI
jgi:hypothetical protein